MLRSLNYILEFDKYIEYSLLPKKDEFLSEEPVNVLHKTQRGLDMISEILDIKGRFDYMSDAIVKGVKELYMIRNSLIYILKKF